MKMKDGESSARDCVWSPSLDYAYLHREILRMLYI
jgi:hypothetical protein